MKESNLEPHLPLPEESQNSGLAKIQNTDIITGKQDVDVSKSDTASGNSRTRRVKLPFRVGALDGD